MLVVGKKLTFRSGRGRHDWRLVLLLTSAIDDFVGGDVCFEVVAKKLLCLWKLGMFCWWFGGLFGGGGEDCLEVQQLEFEVWLARLERPQGSRPNVEETEEGKNVNTT